jgi:periplasmic protein TonB
LSGQNLVQDVRNVDQPSAKDRVGEMLNAEDRAQAVDPNEPKIGAVDESPPSTWLEQLEGAQSNGTLALEQLEALEPGVLEVLAQPQQVAIVTGPGSYEAKGGNASLIGQYVDSVNERVQRSKVNPRTQSTGTVVLKYTVGIDGSLLSMIVISTSGSSVLDGAAISAIHNAAPFPSIPSGVSAKPMTFLQPFKFVLR